jgi:hypothetical protein
VWSGCQQQRSGCKAAAANTKSPYICCRHSGWGHNVLVAELGPIRQMMQLSSASQEAGMCCNMWGSAHLTVSTACSVERDASSTSAALLHASRPSWAGMTDSWDKMRVTCGCNKCMEYVWTAVPGKCMHL